MENDNNYLLEEQEEEAVNKSKNLKRGIAGVAALGLGGAAVYGATRATAGDSETSAPELSEEDGFKEIEDTKDTTPKKSHNTNHTNDKTASKIETHDSDVDVDQTSVLLDENGNVVEAYDEGTIDGKRFEVHDINGDGHGDLLWYDENGNGVIESHEVHELVPGTYQIGQGDKLHIDKLNEFGVPEHIYGDHSYWLAQGDGCCDGDLIHHLPYIDLDNPGLYDEIPNDFYDEKTGEVWNGDLAENNPDYNNGSDPYTSELVDETYASADNTFASVDENSYEEPVDYGYTETSNDIASLDAPTDQYDDMGFNV